MLDRDGCPLCGDKGVWEVHVALDPVPVVRCGECGFMFAQRIRPAVDLSAFYSHDYGSDNHKKGQLINAKINVLAIERMIGLRRRLRYLEVGSGYGFLLKLLAERSNYNVTGIDLSQQETAHARDVLGVDACQGHLADSDIEKSGFDVVACFEVIEHIPDPVAFVEELKSYLRPSGQMLIMTDNFGCKAVRKMGRAFPKWIPREHVCHFTPATLQACVERAGLKMTEFLSYTNLELLKKTMLRSEQKIAPLDCSGEFAAQMRFYRIKKIISPLWFRLSARRNGNGSLMYLLAENV